MIPTARFLSTLRLAGIVAVLGIFLVPLVGCGEAGERAPAGETTLERIQRTGTVRIGYANEAPYAYRDTATGRVTGEAPEIARVILAELGVMEVEGVVTEFGSLIPGLQAGRFDMIAAGMYILPDRCAQVAFSNPTYSIGEAFVVQAGNPKSLHSYEDIAEDDSVQFGVVTGTVERQYARAVGIPDSRITVFPDAPSAVAGVEAGRVDAYGGTSLTVQDLLDKSDSDRIERADPFTDPIIDGESVRGYGSFAFRHDDADLVELFNGRLAEFIGSDEHLELVRPFGFTEEELPGDVTAADLCGG